MSKNQVATVFVSHGAPTLSLEDVPARRFLADLGKKYRNIEAVLCMSAHWATEGPAVTAAKDLETIHDFFGFPSQLYHIKYPAHGDPDLAGRVAELLSEVGMICDIDRKRGLDHGAWVPMRLMFPRQTCL